MTSVEEEVPHANFHGAASGYVFHFNEHAHGFPSTFEHFLCFPSASYGNREHSPSFPVLESRSCQFRNVRRSKNLPLPSAQCSRYYAMLVIERSNLFDWIIILSMSRGCIRTGVRASRS